MEPDHVFQKALENFKKDLTVQQRREFAISTLQDVKDEVGKIQNQHGSAKKLRGMSRMSKFLEAMQQLEQVVSVFLNASEFVAFIWGPIKFFLVVASSRLEILECLLDTFTDISEAMPDLQGYASIFKDQPEVLEVLKRCYSDIIQFCHMAFGVLGRPGAFGIRDWRRLFDSVWKTFRTKFSPVLSSLRRHRELLVQVKLTATYGAVETTRCALQEIIEKSNEELKQILNVIQQKKRQILDKLGIQDSHDNKEHRRLPDQRYPTSGDWILEERVFLQWLDPDDLSNDLLYLNGMPGAGKTTLVSRVIDGMSKDITAQKRLLLNFYFEHGQSGKILMIDMLRSFIEQLLQQDDAIVDDLHETVLPARPSDLRSLPWLENVATRTILAQRRCYVVVDGVDECAMDQRKYILQWLKTLLSSAKASNVVVKVLVSGQRDGVIDTILQNCACTIRLDDQTPHLRDIEKFSSSVLTQIKDRFPDLQYEKELLRRLDPSRVTDASKGMFMYAKVVLDNILSQTSIYELEQELEREYPRGLDEAYERVAERVLGKTSDSHKRAALQILGLVACAARPLKWREMQCYFCVDAMNGSCDPRRRKVGGPKDLCGSFVESEACATFPEFPFEAYVTMVHNTAKSYLFRSGRLDMLEQHRQMSLFCSQYLTRSAFDMVSQDNEIVGTTALTGFYGFFDYAAAHWDHHLLQYVRRASASKTTPLTEEWLEESLSTTWTEFVERFGDGHESQSETLPEHDVLMNTSAQQAVPRTVDTKGESCNIQGILRDWSATQRSTEFERLAAFIRQGVQQTDLSILGDREKAIYLSLNGPFRHKCTRRVCVHFNTGFESEAELSQHIQWHEMTFKCPHMGCYACLTGFPTSASLQSHVKKVHPVIDPERKLFPVKSRSPPRSLLEACRLGDLERVQYFMPESMLPEDSDGIARANRALYTAARNKQLAVCVYLMQLGADPYMIPLHKTPDGRRESPVQMSIKLGDYELFSALLNAAHKQYKLSVMERSSFFSDCVLDALGSPISQFLVDLLVWNGRRAVPLTLENVLLHVCMENYRPFAKRCVKFDDHDVQRGLQVMISSEMERYRKSGQSLELCYEKVLIASDSIGRSLLHRLCGDNLEFPVSEAVKFLLGKLRPEDTRRYDSIHDPPLFTTITNRSRAGDEALTDRLNIIRIFFENDLDGAKNTRNSASDSSLEFAFKRGEPKTFSLVFELCGADYSAVQLYDILGNAVEDALWKIGSTGGLDHVDKRIRMATRLSHGVINRFIYLLTDLNSEPDVIKMLKSMMTHMNRETASVRPVNDVPELSDILRSNDQRPADFLLSLKEADKILERFHTEFSSVEPVHLRKLLFTSLDAKTNRCDVAKTLLTHYELDLESTGPGENCPDVHELAARPNMDPTIIPLLQQMGWYREFISSRVMQDRVIQTLEDNLMAFSKARGQHPEGMTESAEKDCQDVDSKRDSVFVPSLEYIRGWLH